jgi:alkylhydroperoxidase/carboxymuconolactone decarboxylase family protein YurZ
MSYFKELAPDLDRIVVADMFGGMLSGSELDPRTRSLVEALKQVFFFAGLPAAATGLKIAEGVFAERGL